MVTPFKLKENYWETFNITKKDFDFLNNYLLEIETPQTSHELLEAIIKNRIQLEKKTIKEKTKGSGIIYMPKMDFKKGNDLVFPALNWQKGTVKDIRNGYNPEYDSFKIIKVEMENSKNYEFVSNFENHTLNKPIDFISDDPNFDEEYILTNYSESLETILEKYLEQNNEFVRIAGAWFARALLVDINVGYLNLVEAVLEEKKGGPMKTRDLMKRIELKSDVNENLIEFSFNLALQKDERFDEVGPTGEVIWFLKAKEPDDVQKQPIFLEYTPGEYKNNKYSDLLSQFEGDVFDELEQWDKKEDKQTNEIIISLIYPHWRAGTLPLSKSLSRLFPTAYEAPLVRFTFVDINEGLKFNGWVVRNYKYVYGLSAWYKNNGLIPGSLVKVRRGNKPGEIIIEKIKSRQTKEWLKTVIIGSDQVVVFAILKQNINSCN